MKKFILSLIISCISVVSFATSISGASSICVGVTTTLSGSPAGGTWSSSNSAIATIGSSSGIVTGVSAGVDVITYVYGTTTPATFTITVNPLPAPITTGATPNTVCEGASIPLSDATPGGTWSSSNTSIATIGSSSGLVTTLSTGTTTITYTLPTGCSVSTIVMVLANPAPILGPSSLCVGQTITLSDATVGGMWSSGTTSIATVGPSSGIVTGVSPGTDIISYTIQYSVTTSCSATYTVTVNPIPSAILGSTSGTIVCAGSIIPLSDATPGGTWSSSNTSVATVGSSSGIVTTLSPGTTTITYTLPTGCSVSTTIVVGGSGPISGPTSVCVGATINLSDPTAGGTWSSNNTTIATVGSSSGIVTGVSPGTAIISYSVSGGCFSTYTIIVNPIPSAILGSTIGTIVCAGSIIHLSDATSGGTWSSSNTSIATVGSSSGIVTTLSPGTTTITYTLPTGCSVSTTIVVGGSGPISGPTSVCVGATITLSDPTAGGTWSSSNTSVATVGSSSGIVTGVSPGTAIISYSASTGCYSTYTITVNPLPSLISGNSSTGTVACTGSTILLSDATPGGTWSSSNTSVAIVGSASGIVTALSPGTTIITYTLPTGCSVSTNIIVSAGPASISGPDSVCVGSIISLTDATAGGTWSSSNTSVATVGSSSGMVTGVSAGNATITYTTSAGCFTTYAITVLPLPCILGIDENNTRNNNIEVFPNPAYDELTIKIYPGEYNSFIITNELGQIMLRSQLGSSQTTVDIKAFPSGLYYIIVKGDNGIKTQKFVKM